MADQSPAHVSLSAFIGGLMEEAGRKETPLELEVKHVLGQKSQIKMLELRGVWQENRRQVT